VLMILNRERYKKSWEPPVPVGYRLSDQDITDFVNGMTTVAYQAMFSKVLVTESAAAIQNLAVLRPEIIIPPILDKLVCL
jgi:proteasome activator subunit 4